MKRSKHSSPLRVAAISLALTGAGITPASAALPDGISGTWFNASQSGHGLSISIVDAGRRAAVIWHVYDVNGEPLTLYIDGMVEGRSIVGPVFAPIGMRFGEFDPDSLALPQWGEARIDFESCAKGELSWTSTEPEFADGSLPIQPLARIGTLPCPLPTDSPLTPGPYRAETVGNSPDRQLWGIVDKEGRLWGSELFFNDEIRQFPSFGTRAEMVIVEPALALDGSEPLKALGTYSLYQKFSVQLAQTSPPGSSAFWVPIYDSGARYEWEPGLPAGTELISPVSLEDVSGEWRIPYLTQFGSIFGPSYRRLSVSPDGALCVGASSEASSDCVGTGLIHDHEGSDGLLDFSLTLTTSHIEAITFRGRGWLGRVNGEPTLTLVGENGESGHLLVAKRQP